MPPLKTIKELTESNTAIHDLDTPMIMADIELTTPYLPRVYCAILRTVILNALHLTLDAIYIDVGPGKCDCALHVATVLEDMLSIPIHQTKNEDMTSFGTPVSQSKIGLLQKLERITEGVKNIEKPTSSPAPCKPTAGFWGVPPRDFSILNLFLTLPIFTGGPAAWKTKPLLITNWNCILTRIFLLFFMPSLSVQKQPSPVTWLPNIPMGSIWTVMLRPAAAQRRRYKHSWSFQG